MKRGVVVVRGADGEPVAVYPSRREAVSDLKEGGLSAADILRHYSFDRVPLFNVEKLCVRQLFSGLKVKQPDRKA